MYCYWIWIILFKFTTGVIYFSNHNIMLSIVVSCGIAISDVILFQSNGSELEESMPVIYVIKNSSKKNNLKNFFKKLKKINLERKFFTKKGLELT